MGKRLENLVQAGHGFASGLAFGIDPMGATTDVFYDDSKSLYKYLDNKLGNKGNPCENNVNSLGSLVGVGIAGIATYGLYLINPLTLAVPIGIGLSSLYNSRNKKGKKEKKNSSRSEGQENKNSEEKSGDSHKNYFSRAYDSLKKGNRKIRGYFGNFYNHLKDYFSKSEVTNYDLKNKKVKVNGKESKDPQKLAELEDFSKQNESRKSEQKETQRNKLPKWNQRILKKLDGCQRILRGIGEKEKEIIERTKEYRAKIEGVAEKKEEEQNYFSRENADKILNEGISEGEKLARQDIEYLQNSEGAFLKPKTREEAEVWYSGNIDDESVYEGLSEKEKELIREERKKILDRKLTDVWDGKADVNDMYVDIFGVPVLVTGQEKADLPKRFREATIKEVSDYLSPIVFSGN